MDNQETDTTRTTVRTYVPSYQRDEWDKHADELGMSRSEFVRTMVQAGRRGFGNDESIGDEPNDSVDSPEEFDSDDSEMIRDPLEERVLEVLSGDDFYSWEELIGELTENLEDRLESTLQELQESNRVRYSGRNGGYTLDE